MVLRRALPRTRRSRLVAAVLAFSVLAAVVATIGRSDGPSDSELATDARARRPTSTTRAPTTVSPTTATTAAPTVTTGAPPPSTAATTLVPVEVPSAIPPPAVAPAPPPPPPAPPAGLDAYRGLGIWLDVWDWSPTYTNGAAAVGIDDVDRMADLGVNTIYIQTARWDRPDDVLDRALLLRMIDRAHARGMAVVGWYLPTFEDLGADLRRLTAAAALPIDGLGVDIESKAVVDHATRSQRLLDLSAQLNHLVPHLPLSAITLPPVVTEIINPAYWPGHPWAQLASTYDVFLPMGYWGNRTPESGWRDGYRYTAENIDLLRRLTGRPGLPVHPVGGVASDVTAGEVDAMVRAARDRGALGGSLYDYLTTGDPLWGPLQGFR